MCLVRYRFVELYYRRAETSHRGKLVAARVETVVLFLPDVWSCVPTRLEWDALHQAYRKQLERKLRADHGDDCADEPSNADEKALHPLHVSFSHSFCSIYVCITTVLPKTIHTTSSRYPTSYLRIYFIFIIINYYYNICYDYSFTHVCLCISVSSDPHECTRVRVSCRPGGRGGVWSNIYTNHRICDHPRPRRSDC